MVRGVFLERTTLYSIIHRHYNNNLRFCNFEFGALQKFKVMYCFFVTSRKAVAGLFKLVGVNGALSNIPILLNIK